MHQPSILESFGNARERAKAAIAAIKAGEGVLIVDDEDRENEGDLIYAAETITPKQMALLIRECSGIVCLCLTDEMADALELEPMVKNNTNKNHTAFTVTIEAAEGVTTGVSASDRVTTIRAAIAPNAKPSDLNRPGHIFPLRARPGGVLERRGHTEVTCDLCRLAGLTPAGVLCELTNEDGTMARLPQIADFARKHGMPLATVEDIAQYRMEQEGEQARFKRLPIHESPMLNAPGFFHPSCEEMKSARGRRVLQKSPSSRHKQTFSFLTSSCLSHRPARRA